MSDSTQPAATAATPPEDGDEIPAFATLAADPEIAPLLNFQPVVRKIKRPDGWTPELQRELIARIAATGTVQSAVWQMGKHATGAEALYKTPIAKSFRTSWDAAIIIGRRRNGLDSQPPFTGAVPGINRRNPRGRNAEPEPEPEITMSDEEKWDLICAIGTKFMRKVAAERQARLAGQVVAADFYLRQITMMEVMFDLTATSLGFDPHSTLRKLHRGPIHSREIVSTPFSDWLDRVRRAWWQSEGDPERPPYPDLRFLVTHRTTEGECSTYVDQNATGALTTPARGYSEEQWAEMTHEDQRRARQSQFAEDAEAQLAWEAEAHREFEARSSTERSDAGA